MKETKKPSLGIRSRNYNIVRSENPHPLQYHDVTLDSEGKPVFTPSKPVLPSLAEDNSILNNSLYQRPASPTYRINEDMVDTGSMLENLNS